MTACEIHNSCHVLVRRLYFKITNVSGFKEMTIQLRFQLLSLFLLTFVSAVQVLEPYSYSGFGETGQNPKVGQNRRRPLLQPELDLTVLPNWPSASLTLGQVAAVSLDNSGNVVIFHRSDHKWNYDTFNLFNEYQKASDGPIAENTVIVLNSSTGQLIQEWGSKLFYMPHGLTVDSNDNLWVTDVALHQVFKFPPLSSFRENGTKTGTPILTLGERFRPGNDHEHFCKPSAVAVMQNGDFFVSDGYCNSRVMKFDKDGKLLLVWGRSVSENRFPGSSLYIPQYFFAIPHALALAEDRNLLCVADRENGRVQCFLADTGHFKYQIAADVFGPKVFSVAYTSANGGIFYIVNGIDPALGNSVRLFEVDANTLLVRGDVGINNKDLSTPHDVAVAPDGSAVYVVELDPHRVWKFVHKGNLAEETRLSAAIPTEVQSLSPSTTKTSTLAPVSPKATGRSPTTEGNAGETRPASPLLAVDNSYLVTGAGIAIVGLTICATTVAIGLCLKARRRGAMLRDFGSSSTEPFKLGQLLDARSRRGFEQVSTEESDEERNEQRA